MSIPKEEQIEFANNVLPIIDKSSDVATLERLHSIAAAVLKWSGYEDNGVAFALSEYTFELAEIARGKEDTGWKDEARTSLEREMANSSE